MYRIIKPRGQGKTTEILHLAEENNATVVCSNPLMYKKLAQARGFNDNIKFISYEKYLLSHNPGCDELYLIDEIDGLVQKTPGKVIGYSLSQED